MKIETYIEKFNPCEDSQKYLRQFDTFQAAWAACDRGDWMLSAAYLLDVDHQVLALAKGLCANTARHLMKDSRSIAAVDAAIAFGRGEIGRENRDGAYAAACAASAAAYAATYAAAYADTDYATYASASAAASADAASAAASAATSAAAYAAAEARRENRKRTADICREILTESVFAALKAAERIGKT